VLDAPSPKSHCHDVGLPVEVSVNCTACPGAGDDGLKENDVEMTVDGETVTVRLVLLEPEALVTVRFTVFDPAVV